MSASPEFLYHLSLERFAITYARPHLGLFLSQSDNLFQDATIDSIPLTTIASLRLTLAADS